MSNSYANIRYDDGFRDVVVAIHVDHPTLRDGGGRLPVLVTQDGQAHGPLTRQAIQGLCRLWHATNADRAALVAAGGSCSSHRGPTADLAGA